MRWSDFESTILKRMPRVGTKASPKQSSLCARIQCGATKLTKVVDSHSMFSNYFTDQSAISIASFSESSAIPWSCSIFAIPRNKVRGPKTFKSFQKIRVL